MTIEMQPITSSNIRAIGYDPETKELHVDFNSGGYVYEGVTPDVHAALMSSRSPGGHLHAHVKGKFKHRKKDG